MDFKNFPFDFKVKPSDPNEIQICCPFCVKRGKSPDTKYHLYIHLKKKLYHCFRCEASGKFQTLIELIKILTGQNLTSFSFEDAINQALSYFENSQNFFIKNAKQEEIDLDLISIQVNKYETPIAYSYLKNRGISDDDIEEYKIRVGKTYIKNGKLIRKWRGRILFPFFENDKVIYVVGRTYINQTPKYLNSKGSRKDKLFPSRSFKTDEIIVCEGIFDAITAKKTTKIYSVATLGKEITEEQVNIISLNNVKTVYLALDPDLTVKEWQKAILKFLVKGLKVYPVILPKHYDVNSLGNKFPYFLDKAIKYDLTKTILFEPDFFSNFILKF